MQDKLFKVFLTIAILGVLLQFIGLVGGIVSGLTGCYHLEARGKTVSTNCTPEELTEMEERED